MHAGRRSPYKHGAPAAKPIARLRTSVPHVAEIANRRTGGRHRPALPAWVRFRHDDDLGVRLLTETLIWRLT